MPSGSVHQKISIVGGVALTGLTLAGTGSPILAASMAAGCIIGTFVTPDLDVDDGNITYKNIRDHLGLFFYWLWDAFWSPYADAIKHRSNLSHFPVFSTLLRVLYIFIPLSINVYAEDGSRLLVFLRSIIAQLLAIPLLILMFLLIDYDTIPVIPLVIALAGWILIDTLHWLADMVS